MKFFEAEKFVFLWLNLTLRYLKLDFNLIKYQFISINGILIFIYWLFSLLSQSHTSIKSAPTFSSELKTLWDKKKFSKFNLFFHPFFNHYFYTCSEWKSKTDLVDNEDTDTVSFDMVNTFFFRPDLTAQESKLTGREVVTIPHPLIMVSFSQLLISGKCTKSFQKYWGPRWFQMENNCKKWKRGFLISNYIRKSLKVLIFTWINF